MQRLKKVSVIVPCYNSAKYLKLSLDCLINQIYKNIEIICVNNGSSDETANILVEYSDIYKNIKIVTLEDNSGVFHARLAGAKMASGDYIAFMDSDDLITSNWIGALLDKAIKCDADLVFGDVRKLGDVKKSKINTKIECYQNLDPLRLQELNTDGPGILDMFMHMHGLCSHYHYVWNKLLRKDLWDRCVEDLTSFDSEYANLVTVEDIAFSMTFFCHALHVVNIHNEYYTYCIRPSQNVNVDSVQKFIKNIDDVIAVFDYVEYMLKKYSDWGKYEIYFKMLKQRYGIIYLRLTNQIALPRETVELVKATFGQDEITNTKEIKSEYFFSLMTNVAPIDRVYRKLINRIYSDEIKIISFDIFDTLIVRPFGNPADIFLQLNEPFRQIFNGNTYIDFASQRRAIEDKCHKLQKIFNKGREEPTLEEIYDTIASEYRYDREKLRIIENLEMENEIKYSYPRKFVVELFEQAKSAGKTVVLSSDMYLPKACVIAILNKCGITGYEELFLSSEMHVTKHSGRMFTAIKAKYSLLRSNQIFHIGDNYDSDVKRAKEAGLLAEHMPKSIGLFQGRNGGIFTGNTFNKVFKISDRYTDMDLAYYGFSGMRSICAVIANKLFDFPYVSFNRDSDLNGDPRAIGYYLVGTHIYAIARWLIRKTQGKGIRKIHFAARDGYLIQKAYDILSRDMSDVPESSYVRLSRKAFAIADIKSSVDMHSIIHKLNFVSQTPNDIYNLFLPVMSERAKEAYENYRCQNEYLCENVFEERSQFDQFLVSFYCEYLYDADFEGYQNRLADYFKQIIMPEDVFFDVGYSGRVELALNKLLGFKIKSYYIHTNNDSINRRAEVGDFENETFYNYKPIVTGIIREHILSEMCPSTIGYRDKNGVFEPVFDEYDINFPTYFATKMVQDNALEFVLDLKRIFGNDAVNLFCRDEDLSRPFEYYMHYSRSFDRNIFGDSEFEDDLGEGHTVSGIEFWNRALGRIKSGDSSHRGADVVKYVESEIPASIRRRSLFSRALYFFMFDNKLFWKKLGKRFKKDRRSKK